MARQSKALKAAKGTLREDKTPDTLKGDGTPIRLKFQKAASAHAWILDELEKLGQTSSADSMAVQLLADAWEDYQVARAVLREGGYSCVVRMTPNGAPVEGPRPEVAIMEKSWAKIEKMSRQLGFTPAARLKFPQVEEAEADLKDMLD